MELLCFSAKQQILPVRTHLVWLCLEDTPDFTYNAESLYLFPIKTEARNREATRTRNRPYVLRSESRIGRRNMWRKRTRGQLHPTHTTLRTTFIRYISLRAWDKEDKTTRIKHWETALLWEQQSWSLLHSERDCPPPYVDAQELVDNYETSDLLCMRSTQVNGTLFPIRHCVWVTFCKWKYNTAYGFQNIFLSL